MKRTVSILTTLTCVSFVACSTPIDIGSSAKEFSGAGNEGTGGRSSGSNQHADTINVSELRRGGYGGGENVVGPEGQELDGHNLGLSCQKTSMHMFYHWNENSCRAGSLCVREGCNEDSDCPTLEDSNTQASCFEGGDEQGYCVNRCVGDADCPQGMICDAESYGGGPKMCMFPDTPWSPGCDGFCMDPIAHDWFEPLKCGSDEDCCTGLVCSASGACESPAGTTNVTDLRHGGYPDGLTVVGLDNQELDRSEAMESCLLEGGQPFASWDEASCSAGSLCVVETCTEDSDCPSLLGHALSHCVEHGETGEKRCVASCEERECPLEMRCGDDMYCSGLRLCMLRDTPLTDACTDEFR
jgi:hypothetical protein